MKTNEREIVIYFNPDNNTHKKTIAHATSIAPYIVAYSFYDTPAGHNIWASIYDSLDVDAMTIFDDKNPKYEDLIRDKELGFDSWLKVVEHNPDLIRSPIAIRGKQAIVCDRQTEIYRLMDERPSETKIKYAADIPLRTDEERLPNK